MKQGVHPQYYPETKVRCACGNKFIVGSTKPEISVEICNKCHPFFTGKEKLIDTAGKVEKFKARRAKAAKAKATIKTPKKIRAKKKSARLK